MDHLALKEYAHATHSKILDNQSELNLKDKALPSMLSWCREQGSIVVLSNLDILCSNPLSRLVPNCKTIMVNQQLKPGKVFAATPSLINILLDNATEQNDISNLVGNHDPITPQQQRLTNLIKEALTLQATDIHIEMRSQVAKIRFRRHGELLPHAEWLPKLAEEICFVAFNHETDHINSPFNPLRPQHASMSMQLEQQTIRLRLTSLPAYGGYDVVMRLLTTRTDSVNPLDELGYDNKQVNLIKKAMHMPSGAILVAGPTGAGKTTTLASCMQLIGNDRKVYSIEDPIEKFVDSVTQIPVNGEYQERDFTNITLATLRMDPDVIAIGEVRDENTASVMCRAAVTGHLVLSTVHTNSAIDIIARLNDLGVSHSLLASPSLVICLICQRLVPLLCQSCAMPISNSEKHQRLLNRWKPYVQDMKLLKVRGSTCEHCHNQGISGRTVVAEVIWLDAKGREYIQKGEFLAWRHYLTNNGWKTYQQRLIEMAVKGLCDPLDIEKLIGGIPPETIHFHYDQ